MVGAAGAVIALIALIDLFITVFNYDGFSFLASRLHRLLWRTLRGAGRPLPDRARHAFLSLASASMLPATYVLWLGLEVIGFAMMFEPGLVSGAFKLQHASAGIGTGFYLSGGAISSLTFGDVTPVGALWRALADVETVVGLTTFTIALGYVVTTFDVLHTLDALHATVRRHAADPTRPSSILARHFRGGAPTELPGLIDSLTEKLQNYDQGLRRYPVVYYFHTRRLARSIPHVFANLADLIELLRWGLPADEELTRDPLLVALHDEYVTTLERLRHSFVGPPELDPPQLLEREAFWEAYHELAHGDDDGGGDGDPGVRRFRDLQSRARSCAGVEREPGAEPNEAYEQYRDWLPFWYRRRVVLERVADALGYDHP